MTINCTVQFINLHWILDLKKRCSQQDRVDVLFLFHVIGRPVVPGSPQLKSCSPAIIGGSSDGRRGKYLKVYNLLLPLQR